jgi:YbbR domain-containing protein
MDSSGNIIEHVNLSANIVQVSAEMLEVKEVQLIPKYIGEINPNYDVNSLNAPSTIKIKGDANALLGINSVTTKDIDLSLLSPSEKQLIIPIYSEGIEPAKGSEEVFIEIKTKDIITTQLLYETAEVEILNAATNYNAQIKNNSIVVNVTGKAELMNLLQKQDIVPFVDLSGANIGESDFPIMFRYSKGFEQVICEPTTVKIGITNK